jgi:hypothetical protein
MDFKRPLRKIDDFQQRHGTFGLPLAVVKKFGDDQNDRDERAYEAYAEVEQRRDPQDVDLDVNEPVRRKR